jgi:hypothetical protein
MEVTPVKLLYAMAFALFPLAAPAQSPDTSLLTALCNDDYFEDTAGQCKSLTLDTKPSLKPSSVASSAPKAVRTRKPKPIVAPANLTNDQPRPLDFATANSMQDIGRKLLQSVGAPDDASRRGSSRARGRTRVAASDYVVGFCGPGPPITAATILS